MRRVMEQGDFRPMEHNRDAMKDLVAILDARAPLYGRAHATVDTSGKSLAACGSWCGWRSGWCRGGMSGCASAQMRPIALAYR